MKFLIQRVKEASVSIDESITGNINEGLLVFIGISNVDTEETVDKMVRKMIGLRIFEDENGKTNYSLKDVEGSLLLISQFTLYANCKKGNRPSFIEAGKPEKAKNLYENIVGKCKAQGPFVQTGRFGADMKVSLVNDGPFTIMLDSENL